VVVDYTQFLQEDGLAGKRLGFYTAPRGNHFRVDERMEQAIAVMEAAGAEIIEIPRISTENVGGDAFTVLMYEFRDGLDAYFSSLGDGGAVSTVEDLSERIRQSASRSGGLVDYDLIHQTAELWSDEQSRLEADAAYEKALERMLRVSRDEGIDRIVEEHNLDALFSYTGSPAWKTDLTLGDNFQLASSSPSARAGYPIITVPMGELDGLPLGISFFGRAWSEPVLLEIAYDFEQKTKHRFAPSFFE
jgi:amidase